MSGQKANRRQIYASWGLDWLAKLDEEDEEAGRQERLDKLAERIGEMEEG